MIERLVSLVLHLQTVLIAQSESLSKEPAPDQRDPGVATTERSAKLRKWLLVGYSGILNTYTPRKLHYIIAKNSSGLSDEFFAYAHL